MKYLIKYGIMLFLSFYQLDVAVADDSSTQQWIEQHMDKMAELTVFSLKLPPRLLRQAAQQHSENKTQLSCDVQVQPNRGDVRVDYSCDAIQRMKSEALSLAAN